MNNSEKNKKILVNKLAKNIGNKIKEEISENINERLVIKIEQKSPFLEKIKKFFDDYQYEINNIINTEEIFDIKNRQKVFLSKNEAFTSENYRNNLKYLQHEKDKLILIFEIYKKISIFNRDKNNNKYYIGNNYSINMNEHIDNIFVKEIKDNIKNHSQIPRTSIIILISIIFYTIGTISDKMMSALINYILAKYYEYDENQKYPDFSKLGDIHYLAFYYSTYEYIYKRMLNNEKNISIDKYKDILNILQMEKLILKSNYLYKKYKENISKDTKKEFSEYKNSKINKEIKSIKELNLTKEFLVLIEFLCDFIIYEKIEEIIINNSCQGEYSYLIELKETMEEIELKLNNNNFENITSLSTLKFQKNNKERIFNKFYFEKDNIKQIKNKDFKKYINNFHKCRTLNNFTSSVGNNTFYNDSLSNFNYNEENEYNKYDDIDIDEFLSIKQTKNKKIFNGFDRKKVNFNFSQHKFKEAKNNDNSSFEEENNSSFKLPNLNQNKSQQYEELEFLKKMIFTPDFLSQHARNILKFEKQQKKEKKRYINLNTKKFKNNKNIDNYENKYEESKPNDATGNFLFRNNETNLTKSQKNILIKQRQI